jgi:hypothetical protein
MPLRLRARGLVAGDNCNIEPFFWADSSTGVVASGRETRTPLEQLRGGEEIVREGLEGLAPNFVKTSLAELLRNLPKLPNCNTLAQLDCIVACYRHSFATKKRQAFRKAFDDQRYSKAEKDFIKYAHATPAS